jgi:acyl phosphate:glycerol-3-phosphate acyltransferase
MNDILIGIASTIIGYLLGSISFSRVVTRFVSPGLDLKKTLVPVLGSEEKIQMAAISATSVRFSLGPKYGLLASFLDMVKVAVPVMIFHNVFPASPADYLAATGGIIGHNWPLYYKFNGGYGQSPIYGALMVLDWRGILVNFFGTSILFLFFKQVHIASFGGVLLLIPWFYFFRHDPYAMLYAGLCSVAYFIRVLPDYKAMREVLKRKPNTEEGTKSG